MDNQERKGLQWMQDLDFEDYFYRLRNKAISGKFGHLRLTCMFNLQLVLRIVLKVIVVFYWSLVCSPVRVQVVPEK